MPVNRSLMAAAILLASAGSPAGEYAQTVVFGDSLSDAGTFAPLLAPGQGRFTTNPGPVWTEVLAARYGTSAAPFATTPGGTNFAVGGARVTLLPGFPPAPPTSAATPVRDQISAHLASTGGNADPRALYSVWAGANDIFTMLAALPADPTVALVTATGELSGEVARLRAAGARVILVPNMPDIGATPFGASLGSAGAAGVTALSSNFNLLLFANLVSAGVPVVPLDTFSLLHEVAADPARYGLLNVTVPACGAVSALLCLASDWVAPNADQTFLFADGVHPTTAGHRILADYAWSVLLAPAQMSLLAETPLRTRQATLRGWHGELAASTLPVGERRWWARAEGGQLTIDGTEAVAEVSGHPAGVSVGAETAITPSSTVGIAFSAARYRADFALDRGGFTQREFALSLYHRYAEGPLTVSTIGSLAGLDIDTRRRMALGPAIREANGDTRGSNLALSTEARFRMGDEPWRHGPVAGATLQYLHVDGFVESDSGGSATTLGFNRQERRSLVGNLGYAVATRWASYRPWAEIGAAHEFGDRAADVTAYLANLPGNRFTLPGTALERGYGYLQAGVATHFGRLSGHLSAATVFGNDRLRQHSLQVSLGIPF